MKIKKIIFAFLATANIITIQAITTHSSSAQRIESRWKESKDDAIPVVDEVRPIHFGTQQKPLSETPTAQAIRKAQIVDIKNESGYAARVNITQISPEESFEYTVHPGHTVQVHKTINGLKEIEVSDPLGKITPTTYPQNEKRNQKNNDNQYRKTSWSIDVEQNSKKEKKFVIKNTSSSTMPSTDEEAVVKSEVK